MRDKTDENEIIIEELFKLCHNVYNNTISEINFLMRVQEIEDFYKERKAKKD